MINFYNEQGLSQKKLSCDSYVRYVHVGILYPISSLAFTQANWSPCQAPKADHTPQAFQL